MILKCRLDKFGDHAGKSLRYITDGIWGDMLCVTVSSPQWKAQDYYVDIRLQSRCMESKSPFNLPNYLTSSEEEFFSGLNIVDEIYEESKTNLERKK